MTHFFLALGSARNEQVHHRVSLLTMILVLHLCAAALSQTTEYYGIGGRLVKHDVPEYYSVGKKLVALENGPANNERVFGTQSISEATASQEPQPTDLNLAALGIKGPVTLQGLAPWVCGAWPGGSRPNRPCPDEFASKSAPKWVIGDGFTVADRNPSADFPKIYIPNSLVNFQTDVTFTDDTGATQIPVVAPRPYVLKLLPGALEGNHGHYSLEVQIWDGNAASCSSPVPSLDPDYPPVRFDAPSPTGRSATMGGGAKGCWVALASGNADLFGSSAGAASSSVAAQNGSVTFRISIPGNLKDVSTYLRYVVTVSEGDTRIPGSESLSGWPPARPGNCDPSSAAPNSNSVCQIGDTDFRTMYGGYNLVIHHPTNRSYFSYSVALNPFQVVVQPLMLTQLKVLPYTLIYQPPGNASKATFTTTTSFGISMAIDSKLGVNQTTTVDNKGGVTAGFGLTNFGVGDLVGKMGSIAESFSQATSWDKGTKTSVGTIKDVATNQSTTYQSIVSLQLSNASLIPGASGTYAGAPFWSDTFVLIVHPQVGFWQLGGIPVVSLLAAAGTPATPEFFEPTIFDLDACKRQVAPYVTGIKIPGTTDVLTKDNCSELLKLDPFYGVGQRAPSLASNSRFTRVGGTDYGIDPPTGADLNPTLSQVVTYSGSTTVSNVGSYTSEVTDVLGSAGTIGLDLKIFGISGNDTIQSGETITKSTDWTVTVQSSFTATAQSSTSISGNLDDHHPSLAARPHVQVFQDTLFGSFLFQDPEAPTPPQ